MFIPKSLLVSFAVFTSLSLSVNALPTTFTRDTDPNNSAPLAKWLTACTSAGGADKCSTISQTAIQALLPTSDSCAQQDVADQMINLAKELQSNAAMITLTQIFVQQPRKSADSHAVLYCEKAPQNAELSGLYQCQFDGVKQSTFTGNLDVGAPGTIPFGGTTAVNPAGSCPAHPAGPIPNGTPLADITSSPGTVAGHSVNTKPADLANRAAPPANSSPAPAASPATSSDFKKQNGVDAQSLNKQFAALTSSSPCTDGEQACVGTALAQCVNGKFSLTECPSGSICAAVPLTSGPGTSVMCTTAANRDALISAALGS